MRKHEEALDGVSGRSYRAVEPVKSPADPLLTADVQLLLPERHGLLERVDRVAAGVERGTRCAAETAITTLVSPISTPDAVVDRDREDVVTLAELPAIRSISASAMPS